MSSIVPTIDLAPWFRGSRDHMALDHVALDHVATELDAACRRVGFFEVVGHGVPATIIEAMTRETERFFALPADVKQQYTPSVPEVNRGYAARCAEGLAYSVGVSRPADLFEAFNIGPDVVDLSVPAVAAERDRLFAPNLWPVEVPLLRAALVGYMASARLVADTLMDVFAAALGLPDRSLRHFTTHSTDTLRVNHYETQPGDPDPEPGQLGMGEHTDYGMCTVLFADAVPGLQIIGPDGRWHDVMPSPGALLVNLGDLMAQWTNDRWQSTLHRVLPPRRDRTAVTSRRSVAFFHDGNHDALIECLPTCASPDNPARYAPVVAGQHLMAKLMGPRLHTASVAADTTGGRLAGAAEG
ncbi:MAG: 2OG-Fe(II) oxygenase family protein [Actinomycetota bacterium]|nr:MAG: oxidoreductase [Acidimicrobiaceae bacterium]